jgi:CYTH domain-containing protein
LPLTFLPLVDAFKAAGVTMGIVRRFRVSHALARLLHKFGTPTRVTEGHFATEPGSESFVRLEGDQCDLVLVHQGHEPLEEKTRVPLKQGEILLDVCAGRVDLDRVNFPLNGRRVSLDRIFKPGLLDLAWMVFERQEEADNFDPPVWFGPEVTADAAFRHHAFALGGIPAGDEVELSNAALNSILDEIERSSRSADVIPMRNRA